MRITDHDHIDQAGAAWIAPGQAEPICEFDFNLVERALADKPEATEEISNHYRAAGQKFLTFFDQCLAFILEYENPRLAAWVIAMATGRRLITGGITQVELAEKLGCTKANVNKAVLAVQARLGIDVMPGQRNISARRNFSKVRIAQLESQNENTNSSNGVSKRNRPARVGLQSQSR